MSEFKKQKVEEHKQQALPNGSGRISISWSFEQALGEGLDGIGEDVYVHRYIGTLKQEPKDASCDDEHETKTKVAGYIKVYKIHRNNMKDNGVFIHESLDAVSQELSEVSLVLHKLEDDCSYAPEGSIFQMLGLDEVVKSAKLTNDVGDDYEIVQGDCVFVDHLFVKKEYRGHGLGLFMIDAANNVINSPMSLTLINPFPLQHGSQYRDGLPPDCDYQAQGVFKKDEAKVRAYYKKLGFKDIGLEGQAMYLGVWNGYNLPRLQQVAPGLEALK